jgi:hypothetical protein
MSIMDAVVVAVVAANERLPVHDACNDDSGDGACNGGDAAEISRRQRRQPCLSLLVSKLPQ